MTSSVPNFTEISEARVSALRPLQIGGYGIIVIPAAGDAVSAMIGQGLFLRLSQIS